MAHETGELGHGHSVAAWSAVIVAIIGVALVTLGVCLEISTLTIFGCIVTGLAIFVGPVLSRLGYGVKDSK